MSSISHATYRILCGCRKSTFDDYDELVIQYGFVILFIVALPVTPLFALGNNFLETWYVVITSTRPREW